MMVTLAFDVSNLAIINRSFTWIHSVSALFAGVLGNFFVMEVSGVLCPGNF